MTDIEQAVRSALRAAVGGVPYRADEQDVARRVAARQRHVRRRRTGLVMAAVATVILGMVVTDRSGPPERGAVLRDAPTTVPACAFPDALPFRPTVLPEGWGPASLSSYSRTSGTAVWTGPGGIIEVWNGSRENVAAPVDRVEPITILGRVGKIGDISDGYSAFVELGPSPCERWALVAHPGTTRAQLRAVAEGLVAA